MTLPTKDYSIFKFREDNRAEISTPHLNKIIASIKAKNLLEFRPIIVNENMEVLDGQHRLLAAKQLGVEIYYMICKETTHMDVITMNMNKAWGVYDYLNFYVKNGYPEYIKLDEFIKKQNVHLKIALRVTMGQTKKGSEDYKRGRYVFSLPADVEVISICHRTIEEINKFHGYHICYESSRFWLPMIQIFSKPEFNEVKWFSNLKHMAERFGPRATSKEYLKLIIDVYNWRNSYKIDYSIEVDAL